jgi:3D-(3,5/4)-trihydroxycyclohexane-1,2-dione acylhydrolase (decyclizing)
VTVVISENHGFQSIRQLQMNRAGRAFGNEFRARDRATQRLEGEYLKLDLAKNAESLGARAWHVTTPDELRSALREARKERRSCVIVAETEPHRYLPGSEVWWDVAAAEVSNDPETQQRRADYEEGQTKLQRFYY